MLHDYAHCLDYDDKTCPRKCFRGELVRDLRDHPGQGPVGWMHLKGIECPDRVNSNESLDCISRQAAIDLVKDVCEAILSMCGSHYDGEDEVYDDLLEVDAILKCNKEIRVALKHMPSAQSNLSEAYSKAVFTWLMDYQIRAAELKGRYTPYEVLSWVINDWRKENG